MMLCANSLISLLFTPKDSVILQRIWTFTPLATDESLTAGGKDRAMEPAQAARARTSRERSDRRCSRVCKEYDYDWEYFQLRDLRLERCLTHSANETGITRRLSKKDCVVHSVYATSGHGGTRSSVTIRGVWAGYKRRMKFAIKK